VNAQAGVVWCVLATSGRPGGLLRSEGGEEWPGAGQLHPSPGFLRI
jgi:hypothetical protein